jgi:hypothetical protein
LDQFGRDYIKKNLSEANTAMVAVSLAKDRALLEKPSKDALYAES